MADTELSLKIGAIALTAINIVAAWWTRRGDKDINATKEATTLKNEVDALREFKRETEAWIEEQRAERERLGSPEVVVREFKEVWRWYQETAKRVVRKAAAAQSNDRVQAVRGDRDRKSAPTHFDLEKDDDED